MARTVCLLLAHTFFLLMNVAAAAWQQVAKHPELHHLLHQVASGTLTGYLLFPGSGACHLSHSHSGLGEDLVTHCSSAYITIALCRSINCSLSCIGISRPNRYVQNRLHWNYNACRAHAQLIMPNGNILLQCQDSSYAFTIISRLAH